MLAQPTVSSARAAPQRATEARELGERLRAHAHCLPEYPAQMPLAHAEIDCDLAHIGVAVRQLLGSAEREQ